MKVLVFGSCVSRDPVQISVQDSAEKISVVEFFSLTCMASLGALPITGIDLSKMPKEWYRKMARFDMQKQFLTAINTLDFDVFIIDFTADQNSLMLDTNGRGFTCSAAFRENMHIIEGLEFEEYTFNTPTYKKYWLQGWNRVLKILKSIGSIHKILVNRIHLAVKDDQGVPFTYPGRIAAANDFLDWAYFKAELELCPHQFIDYDRESLIGRVDHRWGRYAAHFVQAIEDQCLTATRRFHEINCHAQRDLQLCPTSLALQAEPPSSRLYAMRRAEAGQALAKIGEWAAAQRAYAEAFEAKPAYWWYAVEALRAGRCVQRPQWRDARGTVLVLQAEPSSKRALQTRALPDLAEDAADVLELADLSPDDTMSRALLSARAVIHQLGFHSAQEPHDQDPTAGDEALTRHLSLLKAFKSFKGRILWSPGDLSTLLGSTPASKGTLREARALSALSDAILVSSAGEVEILRCLCPGDIEDRYRVVDSEKLFT